MECKVRDITMTYEEVGTGKPLLALDGWGYSGRLTMMMHAPVLDGRPGWRCLYPELPGHGKTPIPDWLQTPDDMLDVLLDSYEEFLGRKPDSVPQIAIVDLKDRPTQSEFELFKEFFEGIGE